MTEEEREKLEDKVTASRTHVMWNIPHNRGCMVCKHCGRGWSTYPDHVLMELLMDPRKSLEEGCSIFEEFEDD